MKIRSVAAVHEKCVEIPIVVVVDPGHARAHRFEVKLFGRGRASVVEMNPRSGGYVMKLHVVGIGMFAPVCRSIVWSVGSGRTFWVELCCCAACQSYTRERIAALETSSVLTMSAAAPARASVRAAKRHALI